MIISAPLSLTVGSTPTPSAISPVLGAHSFTPTIRVLPGSSLAA